MYRKKSTTPGRRITRTVRTSSKRRRPDGRGGAGGGAHHGGLKQRFEQAAERRAKKWVLVHRKPAPNISFSVKTWVPYSKLTHEERALYDGTSVVVASAGEGGATMATLGDDDDLPASATTSTHLTNQPSSEVAQASTSTVAAAAEEDDMFPITSNFLFNDPSVDAFMSDAIVGHDDGVGHNFATGKHPIAERTVGFQSDADDVPPSTKRARLEEPRSGATPGASSWDWGQ